MFSVEICKMIGSKTYIESYSIHKTREAALDEFTELLSLFEDYSKFRISKNKWNLIKNNDNKVLIIHEIEIS